jgi:hypothetical protein
MHCVYADRQHVMSCSGWMYSRLRQVNNISVLGINSFLHFDNGVRRRTVMIYTTNQKWLCWWPNDHISYNHITKEATGQVKWWSMKHVLPPFRNIRCFSFVVSKYTHFTNLKYLIFPNRGSIWFGHSWWGFGLVNWLPYLVHVYIVWSHVMLLTTHAKATSRARVFVTYASELYLDHTI